LASNLKPDAATGDWERATWNWHGAF